MLNTQLIDSFVFGITVLASLVYSYYLFRQPLFNLKKAYTLIMVFLALYALLNMCVHLIAVTTIAVIKMRAGAFTYDLRFYTLIQFGVLLVIINWYLLRGINRISRSGWKPYRRLLQVCGLQILITLPLFPFNPISLLPVLTSGFLMLFLYLAYRQRPLIVQTTLDETIIELTRKQPA